MSNLTAYWENYDRFYDDFQKEGLNFDDLLLKTKFNFHDNKLTFSHKSKFNFGSKGASASHEASLKHKCAKGSLEVKEKAGEFTVESERNLHSKENYKVGTFVKAVVKQGETGCCSNVKVNFRFHHKNNALFTLGTEDWNACKGYPQVLSLGGSYGKNVENAKVTFNGLLNFGVDTKFLHLAKFFVLVKQGDLTGLIQANVNRNKQENAEATNAFDVSASFVKQVCETTKVGGQITHDLEKKSTNAEAVLSKKFDKVRLNAKVSTKKEASFGITSTFDDVTINVSLKKVLKCKKEEGDCGKSNWLDLKFGASVEVNRL